MDDSTEQTIAEVAADVAADAATGEILDRRRLLSLAGAAALSGGITLGSSPALARRIERDRRSLSFLHLHTGERLSVEYWAAGRHVGDALREIDMVLRDHRTGEHTRMDPELMDLLFALRTRLGTDRPFHVISGYRSPKTNAMLAARSGGVAKKSFHMRGMAIDIRIPGIDIRQVHKAARGLKIGGVGLYRRSDFVHVDTGRVRYW